MEHSCDWIYNCISFQVIQMVGGVSITCADQCWLLILLMAEWVSMDIRKYDMWCRLLARRHGCCLLLPVYYYVSFLHPWRRGCIWLNNMQPGI